MAVGYTEPDPREDLSGMDVARKALIHARLLGFEGELDAVEVESLVPEVFRNVPVDDFIARLEEMDSAWTERVDKARAANTVLRYRATVSPTSVHVGLVGVGVGSSFATLTGTDNQFAITTTRYRTNPIVIIVTDDGVPALSATQTFTVFVDPGNPCPGIKGDVAPRAAGMCVTSIWRWKAGTRRCARRATSPSI